MNEFLVVAFITFLFGIFLFNIRIKFETSQVRFFKFILLILVIFSIYFYVQSFQNVDGSLKIIHSISMTMIVVYFVTNYYDDFKRVYKKVYMKKSERKDKLIDNDLAISLIQAVDYLSKRKIGALITVERSVQLNHIIDSALLLNADVSKELLTSIFIPSTPLHDGAVIIRKNKIVCAKAYFPASNRTDLPMNYGTRHRAALGISEHSDAFTIVVSEETGRVSITLDGKLEYNVSKEALNLYLENILKIN